MKTNVSRGLAALALLLLIVPRLCALTVTQTITRTASGNVWGKNSTLGIGQTIFDFGPRNLSFGTLISATLSSQSETTLHAEWDPQTPGPPVWMVGAGLTTAYVNNTGEWAFAEGATNVPFSPAPTGFFHTTFSHSRSHTHTAAQVPSLFSDDPNTFRFGTFVGFLSFGDMPSSRIATYDMSVTATLTYTYADANANAHGVPDAGASIALMFGACFGLVGFHRRRRSFPILPTA